jgi:hypothetical protein
MAAVVAAVGTPQRVAEVVVVEWHQLAQLVVRRRQTEAGLPRLHQSK